MEKYLKIPKESICNINIPIDRFFDEEDIYKKDVHSIKWYASLKPELIGAVSSRNETVRYEEIQIFIIEINSMTDIYALVKPIYKGIKYPCLLLLHDKDKDKFCLSACSFSPGKKEYNDNILHSMRFSHWIHTDFISPKANECLEHINEIIYAKGDLERMYTNICNAITNFTLSGITKQAVSNVYVYLNGKIDKTERELLEKYCSPYKKYLRTDNSKKSKYNKNCRKDQFIYRYDLEDVWYCLCKSERVSKVIEKRKIRDIEELLNLTYEYFEKYSKY